MSNYLYDRPNRYRPSAYWAPRQQGLGLEQLTAWRTADINRWLGFAGVGVALYAAYHLFVKSAPRKNPRRRRNRSVPRLRKRRRLGRRRRRASRKWIKSAIKRPGALRATVQRRFGARGFTDRGTIKRSVLTRLSKEGGKTGQRARLAITLNKIRKRRRR